MAERIDVDKLLELVQQKQIDTIASIEDKAIKAATEKRFAAIDDAVRSATTNWVKEFGSMSAPGAGDAGDDDECVSRELDRDVLEVVFSCSFDDDAFHGSPLRKYI